MKTATDILSLPPAKAMQLLHRLASVDPKVLVEFLSKVKTQPAPEHVEVTGDCWIWQGAVDEGKRDRYAKKKVKGKTYRAHRWIFEHLVRKLRIDEDAHHKCETAMCVNPFHIQAVPSEKHSRRGPPPNWTGEVEETDEVPF